MLNINKIVDVIVFAGQSNMSGRGDVENAVVCDVNAGFEYKSISKPNTLCPIIEPFGIGEDKAGALDDVFNGLSKRTGSMVSAVVNEYYKNTQRQIVAVSASKGGTSTVDWLNGLIDDAVERLDNTLKYLSENKITVDNIFVVWCQGESDGDEKRTKDEYIENIEILFNKFRIKGVQKFFVVQTGCYNYLKYPNGYNGLSGAEWDAQYKIIREAQEKFCENNDDYILAGSLEPYIKDMKDTFHYNQSVYNSIGKKVGLLISKYCKAHQK